MASDPFEEGFRAGFQRGVAYGKRSVVWAVQSRLPDPASPYLGSVQDGDIDRELRECLLKREHNRRALEAAEANRARRD